MKHGQPQERFEGIQRLVSEGYKLIEDAKQNYFMKIGRTLSNADAGQKIYWSLMNRVLNKAKIPITLPLLENDAFVLDFKAGTQIFNYHFIRHWATIDKAVTFLVVLKATSIN